MKNFLKKFKNPLIYIALGFLLLNLLINFTVYKGDVFDVHFPGKDEFGTSSFVITTLFGIAGSIGLFLTNKKKWKEENIYLMLVIPLSILYLICNPIGKVTDEDMHARKAMAISYGNFFSIADKDGKATYPMNTKINELVSRTTSSYEEAINRINAEETDEKVSLEYTTMALYAPICHMPQAFGMFITRIFGASIVVQCYAARVVNLGLAIFLTYMAIKLIPFKKYLILFIGLLPITLNEFASMASDALAISFCFFYISYILYLTYREKNIVKKEKILILCFSLIIALLKIVYLPLVFLILLIPKEKFNTRKEKTIFLIVVITLAIILNLIWLVYCSRFLIEFNGGVDSGAQTINILTHPISYIMIMFRTLNAFAQTFIVSLCGEGLGHYNVQASALYVFSSLMFLTVLFFSREKDEKIEFNVYSKVVCGLVFVMTVALIYTSVYVQWTPYTKPIINGIQARYFIPLLPIVAIILDNKNIIINKLNKLYVYLFMLFFNLNAISMIMYTYINGTVLDFYIK